MKQSSWGSLLVGVWLGMVVMTAPGAQGQDHGEDHTAADRAFVLPALGPGRVFTCRSGDVACLIAAITTANTHGGTHVVRLAAGTFPLTQIDNASPTGNGANGLPIITSTLIVIGAGAAQTI